jgi:hypothetical protein
MPTIDIPDKICPHCGGIRWNRPPSKNKYTCVVWLQEQHKSYYQKNADKVKARTRRNEIKYYADPVMKQRLTARINKWRKEHPDKVKKYKNKSDDRIRHSLADEYVKRLIVQRTTLKYGDIGQELIEIKRKQLTLKRKIKNNDKENN